MRLSPNPLLHTRRQEDPDDGKKRDDPHRSPKRSPPKRVAPRATTLVALELLAFRRLTDAATIPLNTLNRHDLKPPRRTSVARCTLQDYVQLKKKGSNWMACCLSIRRRHLRFRLVRLRKSSTASVVTRVDRFFNFVMEMERVSFPKQSDLWPKSQAFSCR